MIPVDSNGQPIVPPQEQSLTAAFEAANARNDPLHQNEDEDEILVTPSSSGRANLPVAVPERGLSASPVPSQRPMPTRAHPRAATIPGMTPGRTRCDTCWEAHVSTILFYMVFFWKANIIQCRCDHDSDGLTDDDLAARPHKKEPRARKNGRARQFKGRKRGGVRKGGAKT